jgi:lipopolysaccharide export system protein LptC
MILRLLFALGSLAVLGALLWLQQQDSGGGEALSSESINTEPGYVAIHAEMIETGDDGRPLYRLNADRIEQPTPQGPIYLTAPNLDYQPEAGNHWTLTARQGELPQQANTADLAGDVHASGVPEGSQAPISIDTQVLHLDMTEQLATTDAMVSVDWAGNLLHGRGMRADLKSGRLQLAGDVSGVVSH